MSQTERLCPRGSKDVAGGGALGRRAGQIRRALVGGGILLAMVLLAGSCARELPGEPPPSHAFYFPISLAVSLDQRYVYVVNSNFDLRYNAGWISVVDLDAFLAAVEASHPSFESIFAPDDQLKIPSLAGQIALNETGTVALVPNRGESAISIIEVDGPTLSCGESGATAGLTRDEERTDCDSDHLFHLDPEDTFPDETLQENELADPYAVTQFTYRPDDGSPPQPMAAIGHLSVGSKTGRVLIFDVVPPGAGESARLEADRAMGLSAANGVAALVAHPGEPCAVGLDPCPTTGRFLVATSQTANTNSLYSTLFSIDLARSFDLERDWVTGHSVNGEVGGLEMVGLAFSRDRQLAFAANRDPDSVVVFDAAFQTTELVEEDGTLTRLWQPQYAVVGATSIPNRPSAVVYVDRDSDDPDPDGDLVLVPSFEDDAVYVLMPQAGGLRLAGRLEIRTCGADGTCGNEDDGIGSGPFAAAFARRGERDLLLVTTFFDHGLAIFDITSHHPEEYQLLAHVRFPDKTPVTDR